MLRYLPKRMKRHSKANDPAELQIKEGKTIYFRKPNERAVQRATPPNAIILIAKELWEAKKKKGILEL